MRILFICSNYGSYKDGIGAYTQNMVDEQKNNKNISEITVVSSDITNYSKIQRIFSLKMSANFIKAAKKLLNNKIDIVNIEYPFTEWNCLIIFPYIFMKLVSMIKKTKISVSIHEYSRVNILRKFIISFLVILGDIVFVTDDEMMGKLKKYNKNIYLRSIPSNILRNEEIYFEQKKPANYVYFGLINNSKAFNEMIDGWRKFYKEHESCRLYVLTSSEIDNYTDSNIIVKRNLSNFEIAEILTLSTFFILPIKPLIGLNNATLKTATLFGCIPIGVFSDKYSFNSIFKFNMSKYTPEEFHQILKLTTNISSEEAKEQYVNSLEFSKKYNIKTISDEIVEVFIKNLS